MRLDWNGVRGLRVGVSGATTVATPEPTPISPIYSSIGKVPVAIGSADASYSGRFIVARGSVVYGHLGVRPGVSSINRTLSGKSPYSRSFRWLKTP